MSINTKHMMALDQWFIGGGGVDPLFSFYYCCSERITVCEELQCYKER